MDEKSIIDGLKKICICNSIQKKVILEQINNGVRTVDEISKRTGAGSGSCKGMHCIPKIREMLDESEKISS